MNVNRKTIVPVSQICGEDQEETAELIEMYDRAQTYLLSHEWCTDVCDAHFGFGLGGVVALFLVRARLASGADEWLWLVEGDLPSAYLVTDNAKDPAAALEIYAELMTAWIDAVRSGRGLDEVFPVDAPADEAHAKMLDTRIKFLRDEIFPAVMLESDREPPSP